MSDDWKNEDERDAWGLPPESDSEREGRLPNRAPNRPEPAVRQDDGADGWIADPVAQAPDAPLAPTDDLWTQKNEDPRGSRGLSVPRQPGAPLPKPVREPLEDIDSGKAMAIFSHCSIVLGLPVFIIPLLTRDNAFALHHAKAAGVNFIFFILFFVLAIFTCGLSIPLLFLCYIPALVGIIHAANGERAGQLGLGDLGESIFGSLRLKE